MPGIITSRSTRSGQQPGLSSAWIPEENEARECSSGRRGTSEDLSHQEGLIVPDEHVRAAEFRHQGRPRAPAPQEDVQVLGGEAFVSCCPKQMHYTALLDWLCIARLMSSASFLP